MFPEVFFILLLLCVCIRSDPLLPSIAGKQNKVIFVYPIGTQSERDLYICPNNSACNVIHKRFWLPPIVERLCRCPQRHECKWTWTDEPNNYTMALDNRSQLKFCADLSDLPTCAIRKPAIRTTVQSPNNTSNASLSIRGKIPQKTSRKTDMRNVTALCNCQDPHYWRLKINSTKYDEETDLLQQTYFCSKLKKCSRLEFCGYVRTDTYSNFYRCSCPKGHMCITRDKNVFKVEELLYNGFGYKAFCFPVKQ